MNVAIKSITEQRDFVVSSSSLKEVRSFSREVFENIHIYPLLVYILGLEPYTGIDGDLDVVKDMLAD